MNDPKMKHGEPQTPKLTVLMAVYNGERFLRDAVESILNQTFCDFEFLIINDGSTDGTRDILLSYQDQRIRLVENECNIGLTKSLNIGLALARGEYIARQDADDISYPNRLQKQLEFLEAHTEVMLLGTQMRTIDKNNFPIGYVFPKAVTDFGCCWQMTLDSAFIHTSVMFKNSFILNKYGGYNDKFITGQDAELWLRISKEHKIANLPQVLVAHRSHSGCVSLGEHRGSERSIRNGEQIFKEAINQLFGPYFLCDKWPHIYMGVYSGRKLKKLSEKEILLKGLDKLISVGLANADNYSSKKDISVIAASKYLLIFRYLANSRSTLTLSPLMKACRISFRTVALSFIFGIRSKIKQLGRYNK